MPVTPGSPEGRQEPQTSSLFRTQTAGSLHSRGFGFRQVFSGFGCPLCGGLPAISGISFHLYPQTHDAGWTGTGGRNPACSGGACFAPTSGRSRYPKHVRNGDRTSEHSSADVFPAFKPPVPERALSSADPCRGSGTGACVPPMRRKILCSGSGGTRVQQSGRLPEMRWHGHCQNRGYVDHCPGRFAFDRSGSPGPTQGEG